MTRRRPWMCSACNRLSGCRREADVPADRPPQSRYPAILPRSGGDDMQFDRLKRRAFIKLIGGAIAWPLAARAQQPTKLPIIGFLGASTPSGWGPWVAAFQQRMRELGWIESRTVEIDYRWAEGRPERYSEIAAEFVRLKVRVIVTVGSAVPAVRQVTSAIPIVFAVAVDPLGSGMIANLARPGENSTGLSVQSAELAGKRLEILREVLPALGYSCRTGTTTHGPATFTGSPPPSHCARGRKWQTLISKLHGLREMIAARERQNKIATCLVCSH